MGSFVTAGKKSPKKCSSQMVSIPAKTTGCYWSNGFVLWRRDEMKHQPWTTTNLLSCTSNPFLIFSWRLFSSLKPMQTCVGVTKHGLPCRMMVSSSSIFEIVGVCAKNVGHPRTGKKKPTATKNVWTFSTTQGLTDGIGISSGRKQGFGHKGKTWTGTHHETKKGTHTM